MIELRILGPPAVEGAESGDGASVLRQPKRLAILVRIALAGRDTFARRDTLLGMFWPEQDEERARHALRQALHSIRTAFGRPVLDRRGDDELALDPSVVRCDAVEFESLIAAGDAAGALERYRGDLLPGFYLDDAPEFERWLEDTRARLRHSAATAAARLAAERDDSGDVDEGIRWARRAHELAPDDEAVLRRYLTLLNRAGNRAAAIQAYERFVKRLIDDLEVEPSPETQALVQSMRAPLEAQPAPLQPVHSPVRPSAVREVLVSGESGARKRGGGFAILLGVAAVILAAVLMRPRPKPAGTPVTSVATTPMARRLYDEGMRAFTAGDLQAAERLTRAAVEEDSTFGLAMMRYGHLLGLRGEHSEGQRVQNAALVLAPRQSDHERLLIATLHADHFGDPRLRVLAETLAIRYPDDLEGQLLVARGRRDAGAFLAAVEPLRRLVAVGPKASDSPLQCAACEANPLLVQVYESADSLPAAERTAREWTRAQPSNPDAWNTLAYQLAIQGRYTDAIAATRKAGDISGADADNALHEILLRAGDFATLEHILDVRMAGNNRDQAEQAQFLRWRLLREQGRFRDALAFAERFPVILGDVRPQSLTDVGRHAESAAIWDSLTAAVRVGPEPAPSAARLRAGRRIRYIDALADMRQPERIAREMPSLRADLDLSGLERVRRLLPHAEGMLALARGDSAAGCAKFRAAILSATNGYVKTYLGAARSCLAAGRPLEAIAAARSILRGPLGATGTFGTFTQAHDLLSRAFEASGQRDSARAHAQRVAEAWIRADDPMRARAAEAAILAGRLRGAGVRPAGAALLRP